MALTKSERQQRARLAGFANAAQHDTRENTAAARKTFKDSFTTAVDPNLPEQERLRRGEAAWHQHMVGMAFKSAVARRKRKAT